jgi:hypothetical protein
MEVLLATVPQVGAALYYAAKAASARVDILIEATRVARANNRPLLRRIESLAKLAKGIFDDRHRVAHHLWSIPPGLTGVLRSLARARWLAHDRLARSGSFATSRSRTIVASSFQSAYCASGVSKRRCVTRWFMPQPVRNGSIGATSAADVGWGIQKK